MQKILLSGNFMEDKMAYILLIIGFVFLVKGADWFVSGSSSIASYFRIPSFIIGLTIVACGTGLPEAAISMTAAVREANGIVIGNVLGSNLFNLLVALGAAAAVRACPVEKSAVRFEYPLSVLTALLLMLFCVAGRTVNGDAAFVVSRLEGLLLLAVFGVFLFAAVGKGKDVAEQVPPDAADNDDANSNKTSSAIKKNSVAAFPVRSAIAVFAGAVGVIIGGDMVVGAATTIAEAFGIDETIIGLTVVALGTSLPELVTGVVAARKGETDIAIGNVIGSNIFNLTVVLGLSAAIHPIEVTPDALWDIGILLAAGALAFVPLVKHRAVTRGWGVALMISYAAYLGYIIMRAV